MYLAGLVANGAKMSKKQLNDWAKQATWRMHSEYTVPWVAAENPSGRELALKWIDSKQEHIASSGWATYAGIVAMTPDSELDLNEIKALLVRVEQNISTAPNRVRYTMNGFVIAVGAYVKPLLKQAKSSAKKIGFVDIDMRGTSCKVPLAIESIEKIEKLGRIGAKRKTIKC